MEIGWITPCRETDPMRATSQGASAGLIHLHGATWTFTGTSLKSSISAAGAHLRAREQNPLCLFILVSGCIFFCVFKDLFDAKEERMLS